MLVCIVQLHGRASRDTDITLSVSHYKLILQSYFFRSSDTVLFPFQQTTFELRRLSGGKPDDSQKYSVI